jgi:serine/threonine protein kinase
MTPTDTTATCDWLATEITAIHLVERERLAPVVAAFQSKNPYADATALAEHLVKLGLLTTFQATRLLEGQGRGLVLGPYVLADAIGAGSMGTVYKALGKADHKPYAVKVLPARGPWNVRQARKKLQQFPEETHPTVVPWLDVGTSAGLHYLVWPFVEGETLAATVARDGLLPPARAALIGVQIAHALQWCERNRIWHGAVTPGNVMLGKDGQTRLLDFGVGALLAGAEDESLVDTLAECGTLAHLVDCSAPECVTEPQKRSVRGDQYSLGCTLYYGLTGRYPFPDGTTTEKMLAHQRHEPAPVTTLNPGVPNALAAAIDRLLQKAPEARYNHTDELIAALSPLARQSSVFTPPSTPPFLQPRSANMTPTRVNPVPLTTGSNRMANPAATPAKTLRPSFIAGPATAGDHAVADAPPARKPAGPIPDALPPTPPARRSPLDRLRRKVLFWRKWSDPVACTLLTPTELKPGETTTVQVVLHHGDRSDQARTLTDWRGTIPLPDPLERGESVGMQLRVRGAEVQRPLTTIDWHGYSSAALYTLRVPQDWTPGRALEGTLTVGRNQLPMGKVDFAIQVPG